MVEVHYRETQVNPITRSIEESHSRAVFNDVDAAVAQVAQDIAEGRDPIGVFRYVARGADALGTPAAWDGGPTGKQYDPDDWIVELSGDKLRARAAGGSGHRGVIR